MGRDKADFKATRELLGLTQQDVADAADVSITTVKRWERPDFPEPPADVWEFIDELQASQEETVETAVSVVTERGGGPVQITYYRSQEQYDELGRDPGPYTMANASSRLIAQRLRDMDIEVDFCYPDDPNNVYHRLRR